MSSREEFEQWYLSIHGEEVKAWALSRYEKGDYRGQMAQRDWLAWQASRQALEIVVPEPTMTPRNASSYIEGKHDGIERGIRICREAIEAAGVRTKP